MAEEKTGMGRHAGDEQQPLKQTAEPPPREEDVLAACGSRETDVSPGGGKESPAGEPGVSAECGGEAAGGEEFTGTAPEGPEQSMAALEEENSELMNRLLRLQADFDNYRKRVRAEKEELTQFANYNLLQKLLPVIDNMERACSAPDTNPGSIREGLALISKNLLDILEKEGVTPIDCRGKPFDPHCHEAVMTETGGDYPANTVLEEFQKGYLMNGRVLRASMVKVSVE